MGLVHPQVGGEVAQAVEDGHAPEHLDALEDVRVMAQDQVRPGPLDGADVFDTDGGSVDPAPFGGRFDHGVFTADVISRQR